MKKITMTLAAAVLCMSAAAWAGSLFPVDEHGMPEEAGKAVANSIASLLRVKGPGATGEAKSLAVITEGSGSKDFADHIVRSLSESGGYIIIDRAQAEAAAMKSSRNGIALAQDVMSALKLQALVVVRSWPGEGQDLLAVRVFSRKAVNEPETMLFGLKKQHGQARTPAPLPGAAAPLRLELAGNYEIPIAARYMAVIDLDGDGTAEYAFSDGKRLYLYRRDGAVWKNIGTGGDGDERHYYLDAADMNGNGKAEIFVAAMRQGKVVTRAYEERSGSLEAVTELPGFARVLSIPGRGPVLLRQDHDRNGYFSGTPRLARWSAGGGYVDGDEFSLPRGVGLFDFVPARFGEQVPLLVATDSDDRATVYSRGAIVWKSEEQYWGMETVLVEESQDAYSVQRKKTIKSRLIALDLAGTGREYVIFPKNKKGLFGANEGAFHVLAWTGARLERMASVQDLPGPVLDMQVRGKAKDGHFIYVLVQIEGGMFSGPGARLLVYQVL